MSEDDEQRLVRQGARFQCDYCKRLANAQYAHIIPESDGGKYEFNNLLFLCYECHRNFEPTLAKGKLRAARIARMQELKLRPKIDNLVQGIFDELVADTKVVVHIGRGLEFINTPRIFEEATERFSDPSYLDIEGVDGVLRLSGHFKDENGKSLIRFKNTDFELHTGDFWDIIRKPGKLEIVNVTQKFRLQISQNDDLSLTILGKFFIGNASAKAGSSGLVVGGMHFRDCSVENGQVGLHVG
jgi:hypothetical protein